jgi:hypothetical protein
MTTGKFNFTDCGQTFPIEDFIPMRGFNRIRITGTVKQGQIVILFVSNEGTQKMPLKPDIETNKIDNTINFPFNQDGFIKLTIGQKPSEDESISCEGEIQFALLS